MDTVQTVQPDYIKWACLGAKERIEALRLKGPKRQADEALAYICGFAKALQLTGLDISPLGNWIAFDLAYNGYKAVLRGISEE